MGCQDLRFWMLSFKPKFSISSLTFFKKLFSSSLLSAIRVISSAYLWLLIFLPAILIPASASSGPAFYMICSAYKLNKQGNNIQPWCTPFPTLNQSVVLCPVLTVTSWPANRFLRRQVKAAWYSLLFKNFPQYVLIYTVKGFSLVNEAEVDIFIELSWLLFLWSRGCWQFDLWFLCLL